MTVLDETSRMVFRQYGRFAKDCNGALLDCKYFGDTGGLL